MVNLDEGRKPLLAKLGRWTTFDEREHDALVRAPWKPRRFEKGEQLERQGSAPDTIFVISSGVAVASRELRDGQMQNVALFVPGDLLSYGSLATRRASSSINAVTATNALSLTYGEFETLLDTYARLRQAFWRDMAAMNVIMQEWMVGLGRQKAYSQIAHLLCEFYVRMSNAGLVQSGECHFPLTQHEFADIAGLSVVHINRTLQQLRRDELIELKGSRLKILDLGRLESAAMFDASYLHA